MEVTIKLLSVKDATHWNKKVAALPLRFQADILERYRWLHGERYRMYSEHFKAIRRDGELKDLIEGYHFQFVTPLDIVKERLDVR